MKALKMKTNGTVDVGNTVYTKEFKVEDLIEFLLEIVRAKNFFL